jgi:hypothetical protein
MASRFMDCHVALSTLMPSMTLLSEALARSAVAYGVNRERDLSGASLSFQDMQSRN